MSPCASGDTNGALEHLLLRHFPEQHDQQTEVDVVIVPVIARDGYKFNPALRDLHRPYVLLDFVEIGWDFFSGKNETLLFGKNSEAHLSTLEWGKFADFVAERPPVVYFKRELRAKEFAGRVHPIDWPCSVDVIPAPQSRDAFEARPVEVFYFWGYSHPARAQLHADIFHGMAYGGLDVCSDPAAFRDFLEKGGARKWVSLYSPYYARRPMSEILGMQGFAKVSVSMPGAGQKCFRHAEAPVDSVMALVEDDLAWSYPWEDGVNCIRISSIGYPLDYYFETLKLRMGSDDLYPIYLAGHETILKYQPAAYIRDYIIPIIEAAL